MKLESLIRREGGTIVVMDAPKRKYHFKPEGDAPEHVATVDVEDHARAMLRITEGYRLVAGEELPASLEDVLEPVKLVGSLVHNATYTFFGETFTLEQLVELACDDSGLSGEQWNELADQERYAYIDATINELKAGTQDDTLSPQSDPDDNDAGEDEQAQEQEKAPEPEQKAAEAPAEPEQAAQEDAGQAGEEAKAAEETPLNQLPKRELMVMFEKKTNVKPSQKMTIADLVAGIEGADE